MNKTKLLVSSCLLGENVKYNGKNNRLSNDILDKLYSIFDVYSFCPEVEGGLPTPRVPCEIVSFNPLKVLNKNGEDKTNNFILGANKTLKLCKKYDIKIALLKANSPSCSSLYVYDGSFSSKKVEALGVTANLLDDNNIKIYDEYNIKQLLEQI